MEELQRAIGRIEGKLDAVIAQQVVQRAEHETRMAAVEKQADELSKKVWFFSGAAAVISFIMTYISRHF